MRGKLIERDAFICPDTGSGKPGTSHTHCDPASAQNGFIGCLGRSRRDGRRAFRGGVVDSKEGYMEVWRELRRSEGKR